MQYHQTSPAYRPNRQQFSRLAFHWGEALGHLANTYPTLQTVILELVQNALDKDVNATRVSITINYKNQFLAVRDNGSGTSIERFNGALGSVCQPKRKGEGSLGQFGIGLISSMGKCRRFVFTSCPAPGNTGYQEWTFDTQNILAQRDNITIPRRPRNDLAFSSGNPTPHGTTAKDWRSEMQLLDFTNDTVISRIDIDDLVKEIQNRYNAVMRRNKVKISIRITRADGKEERREDVTAIEFRGRKLPELKLQEKDAGQVTFRMHVAPKTVRGRKGTVSVGVLGSEFRFPFRYLAQMNIVSAEVTEALCSGIFEGEILGEKIELDATRNTFKRTDALTGFFIAMEDWFNAQGRQHMQEAKQNRQDERHQELGVRSMGVIEKLLNDPENVALLGVTRAFSRGNVGMGHAVSGRTLGKTEETFLSADRKPDNPPGSNGKPGPRHDGEPKSDIPGHTPLTVAGPKGQQRKLVRGHSTGLAFSYEGMETSPALWELDLRQGVLRFNIRHPLWVACDSRSDLALMRLQEQIAIQALTLETMPEAFRLHQRQILDELTRSLVFWIMESDKARGTVPSRKSSKAAKE